MTKFLYTLGFQLLVNQQLRIYFAFMGCKRHPEYCFLLKKYYQRIWTPRNFIVHGRCNCIHGTIIQNIFQLVLLVGRICLLRIKKTIIIDTRITFLTSVARSIYKRLTNETLKTVKMEKSSTKMKSIENRKFQKVLPNTATPTTSLCGHFDLKIKSASNYKN